MWMLLPGDSAPADAPPDDTTAMQRAQWAAMMRRAPRPLSAGGVRDTLGPGDAQGPDDRYSDFYAYAATDSATFSVVVVSPDFAPDLAVRRPDGVTVAASTLLRTGQRAEVPDLRGPGRFEIIVTSRDPEATGGYELTAGATRAPTRSTSATTPAATRSAWVRSRPAATSACTASSRRRTPPS